VLNKTYLIQLLITYRYPILVPIAFLEGHLISLLVGFLSKLGYMNAILGALCVALGNLLGDMILYWLGYHKGEKIYRSWGKYIGLSPESVEKVKKIFHKHKGRILFFSKMTNGFGLATAVLFTAGLTRIPFRNYMLWNILGEFLWTGMLVGIGYFLGNLYTTVDSFIWKVGTIVFGVVIVFLIFRVVKYLPKRVIE